MFVIARQQVIYNQRQKEDKKNTFTLKTDLNTPCCYRSIRKANFHIPYDLRHASL